MLVQNISGVDQNFEFVSDDALYGVLGSPSRNQHYLKNNDTLTLGDSDAKIIAQVQKYVASGKLKLVSGGATISSIQVGDSDPTGSPDEGTFGWNRSAKSFWIFESGDWFKLLGCFLLLLSLVACTVPRSKYGTVTGSSFLRNFATTNSPSALTNVVNSLIGTAVQSNFATTNSGTTLTNTIKAIIGTIPVIYSGLTNINDAVTNLTVAIGHTMANTNYVPSASFMSDNLTNSVSTSFSALTTTNFILNLSAPIVGGENLTWSVIYNP